MEQQSKSVQRSYKAYKRARALLEAHSEKMERKRDEFDWDLFIATNRPDDDDACLRAIGGNEELKIMNKRHKMLTDHKAEKAKMLFDSGVEDESLPLKYCIPEVVSRIFSFLPANTQLELASHKATERLVSPVYRDAQKLLEFKLSDHIENWLRCFEGDNVVNQHDAEMWYIPRGVASGTFMGLRSQLLLCADRVKVGNTIIDFFTPDSVIKFTHPDLPSLVRILLDLLPLQSKNGLFTYLIDWKFIDRYNWRDTTVSPARNPNENREILYGFLPSTGKCFTVRPIGMF